MCWPGDDTNDLDSHEGKCHRQRNHLAGLLRGLWERGEESGET